MAQDKLRYPLREEIEQWMREAETGNAEAQCRLGECYEEGYGVKTSLKEARYWRYKWSADGR